MIEPLGALQVAVEAQIAQRVLQHQVNLAASVGRPLNGMVIGDSWADYPLAGNLFFGVHTDYPTQLAGTPRPTLLNLAHYGDASVEAFGLVKQQRVRAAVSDPANGKFDFILASMGGDDVVGDAFCIWLNDAAAVHNDPAQAINLVRLDAVLSTIRASYLDLLAFRDERLPGVPVLAHDYDFAIPSGVGVCGQGPWLKPALDFCGWTDLAQATQIVRAILMRFSAKVPADLALIGGGNFVHVKTQGTLRADQFANELHPNPEGFGLIAAAHASALRALFPGRI